MDISETMGNVTVPALHVSGWYDTYLKGTIDGFRAMTANAGSDHARANQYLLAGPWVHIPWGARIGAKDFGAEAMLDTDELLLRWFNHWLKDSGEFAAEPKVRHFALNANKWCDAEAWPEHFGMTLYLHSGGRANSSKGDGRLDGTPATQDEAADILSVDPEVPVVAPGGIVSASGCLNQAAMEQGNNVLVYTTAALEQPVHVFGAPTVSVYVATSAAFADVVAKLVCVRANGDADFVCIGIARSTTLFGGEYVADAAHLWEFEMEPTSWVFLPTERIRIEIAGGSFPLYDRNPGTDVPPREASVWNWRRSTHSVYHDAKRVSSVHLPVVTG